MEDLIQSLRDFVATSNSGKYATEEELMAKFPELAGYDIQSLRDFVATSNSGKYATEEELLSKFPEFNVKKKEQPSVAQQPPSGDSGLSLGPTSSVSQGFKPAFGEPTPQREYSNIPIIPKSKAQISTEVAKTKKEIATTAKYYADQQAALKKKEQMDRAMQEKLRRQSLANTNFNQDIVQLDPNLIKKDETEVVPLLNQKFAPYGFIAEEGFGDEIIVRTRDGRKSIKIELDNFTEAGDLLESTKLKEFINANAKPVGDPRAKAEDFYTQSKKAQNLRKIGRLNPDGSQSTVMMMSMGNYAVPTLFPKDPNNYSSDPDTWIELDGMEAFNMAKERGELFYFQDEKDARRFAEGAWKGATRIDAEGQEFYKKKGLDYFQEKERWNEYESVRDKLLLIDELKDGTRFGNKEQIAKHPDLFIGGKLRNDIDQYEEKLKQQEDELFGNVFDEGFLTEGKVQRAREEFDVYKDKKGKEVAQEAVVINLDAKKNMDELDAQALGFFGVSAKDLSKITPTTDQEVEVLNDFRDRYAAEESRMKYAANLYEQANTYFSEKSNAQIREGYNENFSGFLSAVENGYARGKAGEIILAAQLGLLNIDEDTDKEEAAREIAQAMMDAENAGTSLILDRLFGAKGFSESLDAIIDNPIEATLSLAANSFSQMLPYGMKIIPSAVVAGAGAGAANGAIFGAQGAGAGAIAGGLSGFRAGQAAVNFSLEYTNAILDEMNTRGYDITDPLQVEAALSDKSVWDAGSQRGIKRGIPIAVVDYLTTGMAGRIIKPSQMASKGTKIAAGAAERFVIDPLGEAVGETAAQVAEGKEDIDWKEVSAEALGGIGNNASNAAVNSYRVARNNNNIATAYDMMNISKVAAETTSDSRITEWANNMQRLGKISPEMNQAIQVNVGLKREAKDLLTVGKKKADPKAVARTMELLAAREELTKTDNRKQVYRDRISLINDELSEISSTGEVRAQEEQTPVYDVIGEGTKKAGKYVIDNVMLTREEFLYQLGKMKKKGLLRTRIFVENDDETDEVLRLKQKGAFDAAPDDVKKKLTDRGVAAYFLRDKRELAPSEGRQVLDLSGIEEIDNLDDDASISFSARSLDEIPSRFRDRAVKKEGAKIEVREKILGLPIGKKTSMVATHGYTYTLTGKEIKDYAIQEQTTSEVPIQPEARVGEEVAQGKPQAEPQVATQEGIEEEVVDEVETPSEPTPAPAPAPAPAVTEATPAKFIASVDKTPRGTYIFDKDGKLTEAYMKEEIGNLHRKLNFRKFANLFRKHIDPTFTRASNEKAVGGAVDKNFSFEELASYIIGDGSYDVTEDQYRALAEEAGISIPTPTPIKTLSELESDLQEVNGRIEQAKNKVGRAVTSEANQKATKEYNDLLDEGRNIIDQIDRIKFASRTEGSTPAPTVKEEAKAKEATNTLEVVNKNISIGGVSIKEGSSSEKKLLGDGIHSILENGNEVGAILIRDIDEERNVIESVFINEEYRKKGVAKKAYIASAIINGDIKSGEFKEDMSKTSFVSNEARKIWESLGRDFDLKKIPIQGGKFRFELTKKAIIEAYQKAKEDGSNPELTKEIGKALSDTAPTPAPVVKQPAKAEPKAKTTKEKAVENIVLPKTNEAVLSTIYQLGEENFEQPYLVEEGDVLSQLKGNIFKMGEKAILSAIKSLENKGLISVNRDDRTFVYITFTDNGKKYLANQGAVIPDNAFTEADVANLVANMNNRLKQQEESRKTAPAPAPAPAVSEATAAPKRKTPKNKEQRNNAARKGEMVYHGWMDVVVESTPEQYEEALKEIAETGTIEDIFKYGKQISKKQAPFEDLMGSTLLNMTKESAEDKLQSRRPAPATTEAIATPDQKAKKKDITISKDEQKEFDNLPRTNVYTIDTIYMVGMESGNLMAEETDVVQEFRGNTLRMGQKAIESSIRSLEKKGLISINTDDPNFVYLSFTEKGMRYLYSKNRKIPENAMTPESVSELVSKRIKNIPTPAPAPAPAPAESSVDQIQNEVDEFNESIGRKIEATTSDDVDRTRYDLSEAVTRAKRNLSLAEDTDAAIEKLRKAEKAQKDFESKVQKDKDFERVTSIIFDEIESSKKSGYEFKELFDKDPRLAALENLKELIDFVKKEPSTDRSEYSIKNFENEVRMLEEDIAKFPVKEVSPAVKKEVKPTKTLSELQSDLKDAQDRFDKAKENSRKMSPEANKEYNDSLTELRNIKEQIEKAKETPAKEPVKAEPKVKTTKEKAPTKEVPTVDKAQKKIDGINIESLAKLDPKDPGVLQKTMDFLDSIDNKITQQGKESLGVNIALPVLQVMVKAVKVLVKGGMMLEDAMAQVAARNNITLEDFKQALKNLAAKKKPTTKLKEEINDEIRSFKQGKLDVNQKRKALGQLIKNMVTKGDITTRQAQILIDKISKLNLDNPVLVDRFVEYASKVFDNAEYEQQLTDIRGKLPTARKNIQTKIGTSPVLTPILKKLFSINPTLIPDEVFDDYKELVDEIGVRKAVVQLSDAVQLIDKATRVLNAVAEEQTTARDLMNRLMNYESSVMTEENSLDYAATIKSMLDDNTITQEEYDLMKKYKSLILPRPVKLGKTKEEVQEQKDELIDVIDNTSITYDNLSSDDEVKTATELYKLAKSPVVQYLSVSELENLLLVIDNINNGYLPAQANTLLVTLNSYKNAVKLSRAVERAKIPTPTALSAKYIKSSGREAILFGIKKTPLYNVDEFFGDFVTKDIFNSVFDKLASNEQQYSVQISKIDEQMEIALNNISKSYKEDANKVIEAKMKMQIYRIQREYESNPGDPRVKPALRYLNETIQATENGDTMYNEKDSDFMKSIKNDYGIKNSKGEVVGIDNEKLFNSFNEAERKALDLFDKINKSVESKAVFTADVIRNNKIDLLTNYNHISVLPSAKNKKSDALAEALSGFSPESIVSTKAKSLIDRTPTVSPINMDVFTTVQRGAKFVLLDYYMTNPVREARKTINSTKQVLQEQGKLTKENRDIINAINGAIELSLETMLSSSVVRDTMADQILKELARTGYRSMLAGVPRAVTELTSNMAYVLFVGAKEFKAGIDEIGVRRLIQGGSLPDVMLNAGSRVTTRVVGSDLLTGRMVDANALKKRTGLGASSARSAIANKSLQIHNLTTKRYKSGVEKVADTIMSTPDKIMMRPLWVGSFKLAFKGLTNTEVDFEKIADNDPVYMAQNRDAIAAATKVADDKVVMAGNVENPFMGSLSRYTKADASTLKKGYDLFNNYMNKFMIGEYLVSRKAIYAMAGKGNISKREGIKLMAAVISRMTLYSMMVPMLSSALYGMFVDDEDDDDEKTILQRFGQGLTSSLTSLILGRDYGNVARAFVNYGVERMNENYLDFLRNGDYDPYKDAIQYTIIPPEQRGKKIELSDILINMSGPYAPSLKTAEFTVKKMTEEDKKEEGAIERQEMEKKVRLPVEIFGNIGYVPFYKDVRSIVNKIIYKELDKELKAMKEAEGKEELKPMGLNKTDLKRYYPEVYEEYFGEGTQYDVERKLEYEKNRLEQQIKDERYDYVPKQRSSGRFGGSRFGGSRFGSDKKKSSSRFGSSRFGED